MKLASLAGGRDGRLVVVSDDLAWYTDAAQEVPSLHAALDDWPRHAPALEAFARALEQRGVPQERFHEREALAPLPRAFRWMHKGALLAGDHLRGARAPIAAGTRFQGGLCVVTGDVAKGASADEALGAALLIGLVCVVGDGQAAHFSPCLAQPAALGGEWADGRLLASLRSELGGAALAAEAPQSVSIGALIAEAAAGQALCAGTVIGSAPLVSGTVPAGATLRIAAKDAHGHSLFGAIELSAG